MKKNISKIKEDFWAYIILACGFIIRIFYIFIFTKPEDYLWSDPGYYDERALQMAKGIHIIFSTYWPPFFHMFLSLIYRPLVWLGIDAWRIKIDVILFSIFYIIAFWCIYQIIKKLFNKKIALIALLVLIFWWPFVFLNYLIMSENLFFILFFCGLYFLITKPQNLFMGILLGILWGFAFLCRPIFALAIPLFLIWGWFYKIDKKMLISFAITITVITLSIMAFNFYYTNGLERSISSNGGVGFAMLWCDAKSIEFQKDGYSFGFGPPANIDYSDNKKIFTDVNFENQKYYYQMGLSCIKKNPIIIVDSVSSIFKVFHSHLFPTTSEVPRWEFFRIFFKIITIILFILSLFSIAGIIDGWIKIDKTFKKYFYLMGIIFLSLLATVYLQNIGEERYIIPYAPLLIILSTPIISIFLKYISKIKFSNISSAKPYWIWPVYMIIIFIAICILWLSSINLTSGYFIGSDNTKIEIGFPFLKEDPDFKDPNPQYQINLHSKISQKVKMNIAVDDTVNAIYVNGKKIDTELIKEQYNKEVLDNWRPGYDFILPVNSGDNKIYIKSSNTNCCGLGIKIKQKPFFGIWIFLFLSVGFFLSHISIVLIEVLFKKRK